MKGFIEDILKLKNQLEALKPLRPADQQRLDKKFRLEWNYNSNHIEGNTLTYGETELLLIFGETKGNHEFREYEEMKGHDVALGLIENLANDHERSLTENFIREINSVLLKEPFYKEAITPDGQSTRRLIKIGEYKSFSNSVRLQNGEMFNFASPAETPALMNDLLNWYENAADNVDLHPVEVAAELHYRFVRIHPFDDGNGRISRLIMNYHLLKNGYPPVIIKSEDKKNYLFALHEADTGNLDAFKEYIAKQLLWSLGITTKAAKAENIDVENDWHKKIAILNKEIDPQMRLQKRKSVKTISETLNTAILSFVDLMLNKWTPIYDLFISKGISIDIQKFTKTAKLDNLDSFKTLFKQFEENNIECDNVKLKYILNGYRNNGINTFDVVIDFDVFFTDYYYSLVMLGKNEIKIDKPYHQILSQQDENLLANAIVEFIYSYVDTVIKEI